MATNDGYSPYPIGLTAKQTVDAINRAHELDSELANFMKCVVSPTAPLVTQVQEGDLWYNTASKKVYRAYIDGVNLLWFEV